MSKQFELKVRPDILSGLIWVSMLQRLSADDTSMQRINSEYAHRIVQTFDQVHEGLDGGVWYSLFIKNLAQYSSH